MFLDIGVGLLATIFLGHIFAISLNWTLIYLSITFVLLPDIDIVYYSIRKLIGREHVYNHRALTHYPIIYIPVVALVYYFLGFFYSVLFAVSVYFHLIHDSFWLGWGIVWMWPFSTKRFKFFPDEGGKITSRVLMTWNEKDDPEMFTKFHNPHWIKDFYLRPNLVAYVEYSIFALSLVMLALFF